MFDDVQKNWREKLKNYETTKLVLTYFARRLSVKLGEHVLFDQAPLLPIPGRHRIGLVTWGEALRVEEIELRGPVRTR